MIDRYVFVRLSKEHASEREAFAAHSAAVLRTLPGVIRVTVGLPADEHARAAWDVSFVLRFASLEDFQRYVDDPEHRRLESEYLAPRMKVVKAWNFEVSELSGS